MNVIELIDSNQYTDTPYSTSKIVLLAVKTEKSNTKTCLVVTGSVNRLVCNSISVEVILRQIPVN